MKTRRISLSLFTALVLALPATAAAQDGKASAPEQGTPEIVLAEATPAATVVAPPFA